MLLRETKSILKLFRSSIVKDTFQTIQLSVPHIRFTLKSSPTYNDVTCGTSLRNMEIMSSLY